MNENPAQNRSYAGALGFTALAPPRPRLHGPNSSGSVALLMVRTVLRTAINPGGLPSKCDRIGSGDHLLCSDCSIVDSPSAYAFELPKPKATFGSLRLKQNRGALTLQWWSRFVRTSGLTHLLCFVEVPSGSCVAVGECVCGQEGSANVSWVGSHVGKAWSYSGGRPDPFPPHPFVTATAIACVTGVSDQCVSVVSFLLFFPFRVA